MFQKGKMISLRQVTSVINIFVVEFLNCVHSFMYTVKQIRIFEHFLLSIAWFIMLYFIYLAFHAIYMVCVVTVQLYKIWTFCFICKMLELDGKKYTRKTSSFLLEMRLAGQPCVLAMLFWVIRNWWYFDVFVWCVIT